MHAYTHTHHWHIITLKSLQFPGEVLGNTHAHTHKAIIYIYRNLPCKLIVFAVGQDFPSSAHITRVFLSHVSLAQTHYSYMDQGLCLARSPLSSVTQYRCWSANGKHTCQSSECLPFIFCVRVWRDVIRSGCVQRFLFHIRLSACFRYHLTVNKSLHLWFSHKFYTCCFCVCMFKAC